MGWNAFCETNYCDTSIWLVSIHIYGLPLPKYPHDINMWIDRSSLFLCRSLFQKLLNHISILKSYIQFIDSSFSNFLLAITLAPSCSFFHNLILKNSTTSCNPRDMWTYYFLSVTSYNVSTWCKFQPPIATIITNLMICQIDIYGLQISPM